MLCTDNKQLYNKQVYVLLSQQMNGMFVCKSCVPEIAVSKRMECLFANHVPEISNRHRDFRLFPYILKTINLQNYKGLIKKNFIFSIFGSVFSRFFGNIYNNSSFPTAKVHLFDILVYSQ